MRSILIISLGLMLTACGTTQNLAQNERPQQYCTTKQQIVMDGNSTQTVDSKTVVECNDDLEERHFEMMQGISSHCGKVEVWPTINGKPVRRFAYACQMLDGTYRYVSSPW